MATSPSTVGSLVVSYSIKANGSPIKDSVAVVSIEVHHEVNKISIAEVRIQDGSPSEADFPISDSNDFIPGNALEISAGYVTGGDKVIFSGLIVSHAVEADERGSYLVITAKHKAVSMTFNRMEIEFKDKTDSAAMQAVIGNCGLTASVDSTSAQIEQNIQKMATDWDFLLARAEFNGYHILLKTDKVEVCKPKVSGTAVLKIAMGESILSFKAELNAERQPPGIKAAGWSIKDLKMVTADASEPSVNAQGNLAGKALSGKLSQKNMTLNACIPIDSGDLKTWADGRLLHMRLAAFRGEVRFQGNAGVMPGDIIELDGVGARFNGKAYVTAVIHELEKGEWITTTRFGLENKTLEERINISYPPANGMLPAIHGLHIATVKKLFEDPQGLNRIQVEIPTLSNATDGTWARLTHFYATNAAGAGFYPEVGDEVVVGFMEDDPRYPVILGSLYGSKNAPADKPADNKNELKGFVSKSKIKISFDEKDKVLTLETPGGNKIVISDKDKGITISDQNSNTVKMDSSGITLDSGKDVKITAKGGITLDAVGKVTISAKQDVAVSGLNVNHTAQVGFAAKGNATAEISASGQTVVKGAMVMIN